MSHIFASKPMSKRSSIRLTINETSGFVWVHRLLDALLPWAVLWFSPPLQATLPITHSLGLLAGLILISLAQFTGVYTDWRGRSIISSTKHITFNWLFTWLLCTTLFFMAGKLNVADSAASGWWFGSVLFGLIAYRIGLRYILTFLRDRGYAVKRTLIVGNNTIGKQLEHIFSEAKWLGYSVTGFIDDIDNAGNSATQKPVLGSLDQLIEQIDLKNIDEVFICLPSQAQDTISALLNQLSDTSVTVKLIPDLFHFSLMHSSLTMIQGLPAISVFDTPLNSRSSQLLKRAEDILLSGLILLTISPVMLALAIGVKLTSPGPVFYRQTRITLGNRPFEMLKFRSMPVNNETEGAVWGNADRKTNTWFGQFIRKTSLDELPQFINVLKGDMSIVGPRPERDIFVEKFKDEIPRYMQKHMVKAGITGLAQINGLRGDTCLKTRVEYDLRYIAEWSLALDLKIILLTVGKVFKDSTAK